MKSHTCAKTIGDAMMRPSTGSSPARSAYRRRRAALLGAVLLGGLLTPVEAHEIGTTRVAVDIADGTYEVTVTTDAAALLDKVEAAAGQTWAARGSLAPQVTATGSALRMMEREGAHAQVSSEYILRVHFHEVEVSTYPLFDHPPYALALAVKMAEVAESAELDLLQPGQDNATPERRRVASDSGHGTLVATSHRRHRGRLVRRTRRCGGASLLF